MNSTSDAAAPLGLSQALDRLAASKDAVAWESIVLSVGCEIQALALKLIYDEQLAEDTVQETLMKVREHAGDFEPPAHEPDRAARSWILKIAANTALNLARTRRRALALFFSTPRKPVLAAGRCRRRLPAIAAVPAN